MRKSLLQKEFVNIISKCQKEFERNLKNKKVMFIYENKDKTIGNEEMFFPITSFYHLTGLKVFNSKHNELNSYRFYKLLKEGGVNESKIEIKDRTTFYKLQVLPQLMKIDKTANMIGTFAGNGLVLQTNKIVGNVNACLGFVKNQKNNFYIPNTALKEDIRNITNDKKKIVAIAKKDINEKSYKNITYIKQSYNIFKIFIDEKIKEKVDINELYSDNSKIKLILNNLNKNI